ncbi:EF-P beta-lysylation protein EpmB [Acinetobacter baumannii]|uniref:L-lysine 2,3-aminomutase n=2 Tax=Acinetobacter baumannii (strain ATCC 19606 / DSM 30007 / JCM 6841 / CCUG 19606 / CIP 70.34 / NBRC 109757 / NCIMB 12457 / NCTC 12156 / 81) TaxID=575584 RepID=D0CC01_ACIB2|nr:EF-P beta-lysylation protein EpmB [Acinetobacter baumannii]ARN30080.1 EF-P beta-lysylation protein EpmB [Acinetobacter baumannii]EEX03239.1 lysine-2,3-aminomutase-related protein [Acinetobacter baumannii ATCC 19606 = CIP 70.34 = JCM 6841]EHU2361918.1 EF-P beta-lysylation protein EpmB [Acinetobacter baumannii]EHU3228202.1 EF-P beta-lysylation protein EpmB [Acinetobacter baumannii]EHU3347259.1 EF-P beta-lysylation protein EpmB [Acinetobacter baumannii]
MINYLHQEQNWQSQLSDLITDPLELLNLLELSTDQLLSGAILASEKFKLRVPRAFVGKMNVKDPLDPLLLQVLPHHLELEEHPEFVTDPLGEEAANQLPGVLHKYKSRFLLTLTGACAVHCRYCFRRHFPYQENLPKNEDWLNIKNYIESNPDINEVILSGGDPLTLSNRKLALWLERLSSLKQVKILRIHSRVPIVIPNRIDEELISLLKNSRLRIILVVHSNHASELDDFTCSKLLQLSEHHITVLNQAVLLKGVNDSAQTLTDLSYRLFEARVMPYYLHVLDKVKGAQHFDLIPSEIDAIYQDVLASLPGYLVPKLVREIAGEKNKTPLFGATTF